MTKIHDTPDHQYLYSTIRIDGFTAKGDSKTGTGFFYNFGSFDGKELIGVVTNKHVLKNLDSVIFKLIMTDSSGDPDDQNPLPITINDIAGRVIYHPEDEVDLCVIPLARIIDEGTIPKGSQLSIFPLTKENLLTEKELEDINAVEDVIMIGYPDGLIDDVNNKPIIRKGITATHLRFDYDGHKEFLIDMCSYSGSSGSPVFLYQVGIHGEDGDHYYGVKSKLIGVLYAGHDVDEEGEMVKREIAFIRVPLLTVHIHIGFVIKTQRITELGEEYIKQANESKSR